MARKEDDYAEIIRLFSVGLSQYRLYSENHPLAQAVVQNFSTKLAQVLKTEEMITFGFTEGRVVINSFPLDGKLTGVAQVLNESVRLSIDSLIFERGLGEGEVRGLLKLMVLPQKALDEAGGFKKRFDAEKLTHIQLGSARYQLVGEDETVSTATGGEQELPPVPTLDSSIEPDVGAHPLLSDEAGISPLPRIERIDQLVDYCTRHGDESVDFDPERLTYEIEKQPQALARQLVEEAHTAEEMVWLTERMNRFLQDRLAGRYLARGADFSKSMYRLARELKKAAQRRDAAADLSAVSDNVAAIFERSGDEVKLEMVVRALQDHAGDNKMLKRVLNSHLRARDVRERLLEALTDRLGALGFSADDLEDALTSQLQRKKGTVGGADVSPAELAELRRIRDLYNQSKGNFEQRLSSLEQENKRITDEKVRVDTIIRNMAEGLVVVDNKGKIQIMNPAAEKLLGMSATQARGVPVPEILKAEHLLALAKGPLRDHPDHITKEIEVKSKRDDTRRVLQASSAVVENEMGRTVGMVSVLSDITRQKEIEEMKSAFVAHVSHELRTPLFAIEQSLSLLLEKETKEFGVQEGEFLSIAHRNIIRLSRLVNDLLDIARLEARQMKLSPILFKIRDMVHHAVETVRGWAGSMELQIEERYPEDDVEIEADPDRLTQVITNLLGNAIKFTPPGGRIVVEINASYLAPEISAEVCVAVSVEDTGIGIAAEDQKRIFEKFEQVGLMRPKGISSSGLGLTIAKEIVELHGGKIWVDSSEGQGSRFTFVIPRRLPKAELRAEES
jgi:PAS domain S-box-containing protein